MSRSIQKNVQGELLIDFSSRFQIQNVMGDGNLCPFSPDTFDLGLVFVYLFIEGKWWFIQRTFTVSIVYVKFSWSAMIDWKSSIEILLINYFFIGFYKSNWHIDLSITILSGKIYIWFYSKVSTVSNFSKYFLKIILKSKLSNFITT